MLRCQPVIDRNDDGGDVFGEITTPSIFTVEVSEHVAAAVVVDAH